MKFDKLKNNHPSPITHTNVRYGANPLLKRGQLFFKKLFAFRSSLFAQKGQVLLLSTLILSSIIISVSFFVGFLMMQRLRQTILAVDSAQAFYLSDTGVELELYRFAKGDRGRPCTRGLPSGEAIKTSVKTNGDFTQGDSSLGLEIHSTGCVGDNCKISRSQADTSRSLTKNFCNNLTAENAGLCDSHPPAACP